MLIELLTPIVANGTTAFRFGYEPWLPFYNFLPVILLAGFAMSLLTQDLFWGVNFSVSSYFALIPTWGAWRAFDLDPKLVFTVWAINTAFLVWLTCFMRDQRKRRIKEIGPGEEHEHRMGDFEAYEDYLQHIKTAHPDIWEKYHKEENT